MSWPKIRLAILIFFAVVLCLQLPATLYVDSHFVFDFMSAARIFQLGLAIFLMIVTAKREHVDTLSVFLFVSIVIQTMATIFYEPKNELVAYNFTAILIIISAITFQGKLKSWLTVNFPIYILSLIVPVFFKSNALYSTVSLFISNFLFGVFSLAIALVLVIIYSAQEFFNTRLKKELADQELKIKSEFDKIQKLQVKIALGSIASQVAHDIRSPLSALNAAMESANQISGQERVVINNALQRINDIANDLLQKGKQDSEVSNLELTSENILAIVTQIISEKKMQFREHAKLIIETDLLPSTGILAKVNSKELSRVISNLINNAVEALENHNGKIIVGVTKLNQQVEITIKDNGKGIPSEIIKRLGEEGFSHNKDGNGLGLFHAKQTIEKFNGELIIESIEQQGTTIRILLPVIEYAQTNNYEIVLLDNDPLVRMTWEMKAKRNNKKILCLATYSELKSQLNTIDRNTNFYIDVHLSDNEDGVQVAKDLFDQGFSNLYLATGYEPEKFSHVTWIKGVVGKSPVV